MQAEMFLTHQRNPYPLVILTILIFTCIMYITLEFTFENYILVLHE